MRTLFCFLISIVSINLFAKEGKKTPSKIESVTVYLKGANVKRTATAKLTKGENKIILSGLSDRIDENSILAKVKGNAALLSVGYQLSYLEMENRNDLIQAYRDSLQTLANQRGILNYKKDVYSTEKSTLLLNNNLRGSETGFEVSDLKTLLAYQRTQVMEINEIFMF